MSVFCVQTLYGALVSADLAASASFSCLTTVASIFSTSLDWLSQTCALVVGGSAPRSGKLETQRAMHDISVLAGLGTNKPQKSTKTAGSLDFETFSVQRARPHEKRRSVLVQRGSFAAVVVSDRFAIRSSRRFLLLPAPLPLPLLVDVRHESRQDDLRAFFGAFGKDPDEREDEEVGGAAQDGKVWRRRGSTEEGLDGGAEKTGADREGEDWGRVCCDIRVVLVR